MAEILKLYRETCPAGRLAGIAYGNEDRDGFGGFSAKWDEWFAANRFAPLEKLRPVEDAYLGAMRMVGGRFEYWIGMLLPPGAAVPEGFAGVDIAATEMGVAWVHGREDNGEVFRWQENAVAAMKAEGWNVNPDGWFFERYNCPRYTQPDANGEVILDQCAFLR